MDTNLLPERSCGPCTACCVHLTIDDPQLQKLPGVACQNCATGSGCTVYETRPDACRTFYCGWRRLKWVGEAMRPDRSDVMVVLVKNLPEADVAGRPAVGFVLIGHSALRAEGLAEAVAAAVNAGLGTYLLVPGPPGYTASRQRLNERLADAIGRRDKPGVLRMITKIRSEARAEAREPIVFKNHDGGEPAMPDMPLPPS